MITIDFSKYYSKDNPDGHEFPEVCQVYFEHGVTEVDTILYTNSISRDNLTVNVFERGNIPTDLDENAKYLIKANLIDQDTGMLYIFDRREPLYIPKEDFKKMIELFEVATKKVPFIDVNSEVKVNVLTGCAGQGKTCEFFNLMHKLGKDNYESDISPDKALSFLIYLNDRYNYQEFYHSVRKIFQSKNLGENYVDYMEGVKVHSLAPFWVSRTDTNFPVNENLSSFPIFWNDENVLYLSEWNTIVKIEQIYNIFYDEIRLNDKTFNPYKKVKNHSDNGFNYIMNEVDTLAEAISNDPGSWKKQSNDFKKLIRKRKNITSARIKHSFPKNVLNILTGLESTNNRLFLAGTFLLHTTVIQLLLEKDNVKDINLYLLNGDLFSNSGRYTSETLPLIVSLIEKIPENQQIFGPDSANIIRKNLLERKGTIPGELLFQWLSSERYVSRIGENSLQATTYNGLSDENPAVGSYFLPTIGPLPDFPEKLHTAGKFYIEKNKYKQYILSKIENDTKTRLHSSKSQKIFFNIFTICATTNKDLLTNFCLAYLHQLSAEQFYNLPLDFGKLGYGRVAKICETHSIALIVVCSILKIDELINLTYYSLITNMFLNVNVTTDKMVKLTLQHTTYEYSSKVNSFKVLIGDEEDVNEEYLNGKKFPFAIPGEYNFEILNDNFVENKIKRLDIMGIMRGPCRRGNENSPFDSYGVGNVGEKIFNFWGEAKNNKSESVQSLKESLKRKTGNELEKCFKNFGTDYEKFKPNLVMGFFYDPSGAKNTNSYISFKAKCTGQYNNTTFEFYIDYIIVIIVNFLKNV